MEALVIKRVNYYVAAFFMLIFVLCDLMFDFLFTFNGSNIVSFMFTLGASAIVFVCTWKIKKAELQNSFNEVSKFIKSNFDKAQVIFSILDIVCGIISILSSLMVFAFIFKVVKILYIPTKILVVCNKEKTLVKPVVQFSLIWVSMRLLNKKGGAMLNFLKRNKWTLIIGTILGALTSFATLKVLPLYFALPTWLLIVICAVVFVGIFALAYFLGGDTAKSILFRLAKKFLPAEEYNTLVDYCNNLLTKVQEKQEDEKAKEVAKKRFNAEKKAEQKAAHKAEKQEQKELATNTAKQVFEEKVQKELDALKQAVSQEVGE